ncbi:MAG: PHP domain-containing protein [Oscillospiraceae bacterium]|nr:PHP domain-containing protein [Oscillospiraceae bacterium]
MEDGLRKVDLHMHTAVSDGTDTPEELLTKVKGAGISFFSVTDHDAVRAGQLIRPLLSEKDPRFIPGVEFSCRDETGKCHILGYGFDPDHAAMQGLIKHGHDLRMQKAAARLDFLKSEFGFTFPEEEIEWLLTLDNPGKPHIGNLMVKYGYAQTMKAAIRDYINRIRFAEQHICPKEAIEGILAGGGIPVLAHPFYGSGDELILGEEMEARLRRLMGFGLCGVEAFYSGFSSKLRRDALDLAEKYGLYVTAGSDYHGANKLVKLGDTGLDSVSEYPEGLRRFLSVFLP